MQHLDLSLGRVAGTAGRSDADILEAAHQLVDHYLIYLRHHEMRSDLFDSRELPSSKDAIVSAFRVVIATESRESVRTLLIKAGMTLAQFQEDIGEPMILSPVADENLDLDDTAEIDVDRLRKFEHALAMLDEDRTRLSRAFQSARRIAERKPVH